MTPIIFGRPEWDEAVLQSAKECLESGWWGEGLLCDKLSAELRRLTGCLYAIPFGSGTGALHSTLVAIGLSPGDEVVTTPMTYAATAHAVRLAGGTPVFADIDPETGCLDPEAFRAAITPRTVGVIPVHLAGRLAALREIRAIAFTKDLWVVEDAAHALGAMEYGKMAGAFGIAGIYSFSHSKNFGAPEGGALVTNYSDVAKEAEAFGRCGEETTSWQRSIGAKSDGEIISVGTNYRPTDLMASIILPKLLRMKETLEGRRKVWSFYDRALSGLPVFRLASPGERHSMYLYQIHLSEEVDRDLIRAKMKKGFVGTGVHYRPLHLETAYGGPARKGEFPHAEAFGRSVLSLPFSTGMTEEEVLQVAEALKAALGA